MLNLALVMECECISDVVSTSFSKLLRLKQVSFYSKIACLVNMYLANLLGT